MPRAAAFLCLPALAILSGSVGCLAPQLPPVPSEAASSSLVRVMPIARDQVFPKVVGVLMAMGYQVRCVNPDVGQVNIFRTWEVVHGLSTRVPLTMEGTLFFQPEGAGTTRVRTLVTEIDPINGRQILDPDLCQELLRQLESALR